MLVKGEWQRCDDGITRPLMRATVLDVAGISMPEDFLIDSGADRTVLRASLLTRLRLPTQSPPPKLSLSGVGGSSAFVIVTTVVEFSREDGGTVRMRGEFAGFTDIDATDLSVLGRDVLDHFDVLLSRGVTKWSSSPSGTAIALNRRDGACGNWHVPRRLLSATLIHIPYDSFLTRAR